MLDEKKQGHADHDSDPARTPGDGWVGEGGASHLGPATHLSRDEEGDVVTEEEDDLEESHD